MEVTLIRMRHQKKASTLAKKQTKEKRIGVPFDYIEPSNHTQSGGRLIPSSREGEKKTQTVKQSSEKTRTTTSIPKV